jgi:hypothetical protein
MIQPPVEGLISDLSIERQQKRTRSVPMMPCASCLLVAVIYRTVKIRPRATAARATEGETRHAAVKRVPK